MKKCSRILALLLVSLMVLAVSAPAFATQESNAAVCAADMVSEDGTEYLVDPATGNYQPINHIEKDIANITAATPRDYVFEQEFEAQRKSEAAAALSAASTYDMLPPPGGVGYGMFYETDFFHNFTTGTSISFDIICPTKPGGNVNDYLYLTGMNRASKGVEAFILYNKQNDLMFKVYDWARAEADRWQVSLPYSELGNYLRTKTIHGQTRQYITVQNRTYQSGTNQWTNVVWLQNKNGSYDQVYIYTYSATLADQKDSYTGSWGPIVETFQDSYSNTNPVGFAYTYIQTKTTGTTSSDWGSWQLLSDTQSYIRNDNKGFNLIFLDPNYSFAVH